MFLRALRFFFLLNGRNDSPRSAPSADYIFIGNRQKVPLINREFAADLGRCE